MGPLWAAIELFFEKWKLKINIRINEMMKNPCIQLSFYSTCSSVKKDRYKILSMVNLIVCKKFDVESKFNSIHSPEYAGSHRYFVETNSLTAFAIDPILTSLEWESENSNPRPEVHPIP